MTTTAVPAQLPSGRNGPARVGQATAVEQSRAVAEVQAAVIVAQQNPRQTQYALQSMRDACANPRLASRAFFSLPRASQRVSGPSIHLARELARIWGNISYSVVEQLRDDEHGQSEMLASAWDLETNARVAAGFIVPHKRDGKKGEKPTPLIDMRDIYENNANMGARRVRECLFAVLPLWLTDEAQEICAKTNEEGGGLPLQQRIANALTRYAALGITEKQLEERLGRSTSRWTGQDLAQLTTLYSSLQRGEVRREEEFPANTGVTAAEIMGSRPNQGLPLGTGPDEAAAIADEQPPVDSAPPGAPSRSRRTAEKHLFAVLGELGVTDRDDRLAVYSALKSPPIGSTTDLDGPDIESLIAALEPLKDLPAEERQAEVGGLISDGQKVRAGGSEDGGG